MRFQWDEKGSEDAPPPLQDHKRLFLPSSFTLSSSSNQLRRLTLPRQANMYEIKMWPCSGEGRCHPPAWETVQKRTPIFNRLRQLGAALDASGAPACVKLRCPRRCSQTPGSGAATSLAFFFSRNIKAAPRLRFPVICEALAVFQRRCGVSGTPPSQFVWRR